MYKHLTPKKDQLFRRQVKQAFKQRQKKKPKHPNKQIDKQTKCNQKKPHSTNGNCVGKHRNICTNKTLQKVTAACARAVQDVQRTVG